MATGLIVADTFFWNLSLPVGLNQPNKADDVELVRFGYHMMSIATDVNQMPQAVRDALKEMRAAGGFDSDLDKVIRAHQAHKKIPIDGKVSVARPTVENKGRYEKEHSWIMTNLNAFMRDFDLYPRIDLHPNSGFIISRIAAGLRGL